MQPSFQISSYEFLLHHLFLVCFLHFLFLAASFLSCESAWLKNLAFHVISFWNIAGRVHIYWSTFPIMLKPFQFEDSVNCFPLSFWIDPPVLFWIGKCSGIATFHSSLISRSLQSPYPRLPRLKLVRLSLRRFFDSLLFSLSNEKNIVD